MQFDRKQFISMCLFAGAGFILSKYKNISSFIINHEPQDQYRTVFNNKHTIATTFHYKEKKALQSDFYNRISMWCNAEQYLALCHQHKFTSLKIEKEKFSYTTYLEFADKNSMESFIKQYNALNVIDRQKRHSEGILVDVIFHV